MSVTVTNLGESPPFDEAVESLRGFLRQQGHSDNVRWIWRESIIPQRLLGLQTLTSRRVFIDANRLASEQEIRKYYEIGVKRQLGLALRVCCLASNTPLCYVDIPEDETDAEYAMMSALRCSIPKPCPKGILIRFKCVALTLRFFMREPPYSLITNRVPLRPRES